MRHACIVLITVTLLHPAAAGSRADVVEERPASQGSGGQAGPIVRKAFGGVSQWMLKAAEQVPEARYSYRPDDSVRTFGQLVAHVVDSYNYFCEKARGRTVKWSSAVEDSKTGRGDLIQKLKAATASCDAAYTAGTNLEALVENVAHTNLHYGNVITYMRMMKLTPPSSGQ